MFQGSKYDRRLCKIHLQCTHGTFLGVLHNLWSHFYPWVSFYAIWKSWFSGFFLCLNSVRILGQKKSGKSWILKSHNFWSKRRNIIGNGAKHIYFIQRIHWKNFQVWVLTRNSSSENFSFYVKSVKTQKIKIFRMSS